jgi:hypothetical protein
MDEDGKTTKWFIFIGGMCIHTYIYICGGINHQSIFVVHDAPGARKPSPSLPVTEKCPAPGK